MAEIFLFCPLCGNELFGVGYNKKMFRCHDCKTNFQLGYQRKPFKQFEFVLTVTEEDEKK